MDKIIGPVLKARTVCGGCLHFVKEAFFNTLCFPLELLLDLSVKKQLSVFWNPALRVAMFVFPFVIWWRLFRKCEVYAQCETLSLQYIGHSYLYRSDSEGLKK